MMGQVQNQKREVMELEGWYEEDSEVLTSGKFIALEVSDHEDDYNSSNDSPSEEEQQELKQTPTRSQTRDRYSREGSGSRQSPAHKVARTPEVAELPPASAGSATASSKSGKRWSMLSNNSKKRWSSLSFTSDERRRSPSTSSIKRRSVISTTSDDKRTATPDLSRRVSTSTSSVHSSIPNLKRSSTSNSLRQMFGKIALQDDQKENKTTIKRFLGKMSPRRTTRSSLGTLDPNMYSSLPQRNSYADNSSIISSNSMASTASSRWKFWKKTPDMGSFESSPSYSSASLKTRLSQSSLKQKSSHSSLNKLTSHHRNSVTSESISLPMPDQVSRDKLRTKLRSSTSILSINSTVATEEFDEFQISQLLKLCEQSQILPVEQLVPEWNSLQKLSKHVYRGKESVFKVLPLAQDDFTHSKHLRVKELELLRLFNGTPGFTQMCVCHLALVENDPTLICELKYAGKSLAHVRINSWAAALNIWWQCAVIIYAAETKFQFEHRDLQFEHVLVDASGNVTLCDYKLARASQGSVVYYTRLDHPLFFQGRGDYRYEVYNTMRHWCADSWARYDPRNNLLWLHYLGVKLIESMNDVPHDGQYSELLKLIAQVNPNRRRKALFRRSDQILNCGDVLRLRR